MKRFVVGLLICVLLVSAGGCKSWNVSVMNMQFKDTDGNTELSDDEKIGVIVVLAAAAALAFFAFSQ